jgi:alpha-glucosidase
MEKEQDFLWWRDGVIYQIYPLSFKDSNGDGFGDINGITASLDYLVELGIDAIWLSPINPSPKFDWGYDVSDYENIDPLLGAMADFENLLREAHARGIRVIMDMVFNHTSYEHPWFQESRSSRDNPKADWYIWRDKPNNWASVFGGSAWQWEPLRKQYYYHQFLKEQPDLNWRNPEVKAEILRIMKFWLDKGVDGFRLDVANGYVKDAEFRDNPEVGFLMSINEWRAGFYDNPKTFLPFKTAWQRQSHIYDRDQAETQEIHRAFRRLLDLYPERCMVGEIGGKDLKITASYTGIDKLHLAFPSSLPAFTGYHWSPEVFRKVIAEVEAAFGSEGQPAYFLSNHDIPRHISRYGNDDRRAEVAAAMLLTLRGTPFLYYGEEIGMSQVHVPPWRLRDTIAKRYWPIVVGRDGCRTPMQWNSKKNAGFSSAKSWLPVGKSYRKYNVEYEKNDPRSLLSFYKKLMHLRKNKSALQRGSYLLVEENSKNILSYLRRSENQTLLVILNFSSNKEQLLLKVSQKWRTLLSNCGKSGEFYASWLRLEPYEVLIAEEIK